MNRLLSTITLVLAIAQANSAFSQDEGGDQPTVTSALASPVNYDDGNYDGKVADYQSVCGDCGGYGVYCGCGPTWYVELESISMRYRRADGTSYDASDPAAAFDFGRQLVPRVTGGVIFSSGLGVRLRVLDYDHADTNPLGVEGSIDTTIADLEFFENMRLGTSTAVEWSIGVRHSEFTESLSPHPLLGDDLLSTEFDGIGVVAGMEVNRMIRWGSIYARARGALLVGDRTVFAPGAGFPEFVQQDITPGMFELAVGWEFSHVCHNGLVLTSGVGWEVQQWMNYSIATPSTLPSTTPVDVGFDGIVFSCAVGW